MKPEFESISPFFAVGDVVAALLFYCDKLGFDVGWQWGEPPTHANVCRDKVSISLSANSPDQGFGSVFVVVGNVDNYYRELQGKGVELGPLADRDYGMRDFLVVDPWQNRIVFGEPVRG